MRLGRGAKAAFNKATGNLGSGANVNDLSSRMGRRRLAEQLSGTTDHSSRKYKNARDYISRHARGSRRSESPQYQSKIQEIQQKERQREMTESGVSVKVKADVKISEKTWRGGQMSANFTGDEARQYMEAVNRGDANRAMEMIVEKYDSSGRMVSNLSGVTNVRSVEYGG